MILFHEPAVESWSIKPLNKVRGSYISGYDCPAILRELKLWKLGHYIANILILLVMVDFGCPGRPTNLIHLIVIIFK